MTAVRNETQRHSAALKSAGQNPIGLLPLFHARLLRRHSSLFQLGRRHERRGEAGPAQRRLVPRLPRRQGFVRFRLRAARRQVRNHDRGKCAKCGCQAPSPRWLSPPDLKPVLPESSFNRPRGACSFVRRPSLAASIGSAHRSWRLAPTGSACHPASKPRMPHADSRERRYARLACRSPPYHHLLSFKPSRNASPTRSVTL